MTIVLILAACAAGARLSPEPLHAQRGAGASVAQPGAFRQGIAGRVTNADGSAAPGAIVTVLHRMTDPRGGTRVGPVSATLQSVTDEQGRYSLYLTPGRYFVVVLPRNRALGDDRQPIRQGHRRTYYPHSPDLKGAAELVVGVGTPAQGDIQLIPSALMAITGIVSDSQGNPVSGARVLLAHSDGLFGVTSGAFVTRPNGRFAVAGLPPGTYHLHYREGAWPSPPNVLPKVSVARVTLTDRDALDVRVASLPMVRVTGRVMVDPAHRSALGPETMVGGVPLDFDGNPGPTRPGRLQADLTFEFHAWPSVGTIRVGENTGEWTVTRIRVNGVDLGTTIEFRVGQPLEDVEVEIAPAVRGR